MYHPCDHHVLSLAHSPAYRASVLGRSLSEDAYAQSHLSRLRGWSHLPASLSMTGSPPISPPDPSGSPERIRRLTVLRSKQLSAQDQASRSLWNDSVPVNRLPPEILLEIFQALKTMTEDDEDMWMIPGNYVSWTPLSHVCRAWRDVICNSAQLWRDIHVKNELQWVELCLSRSRETPLHVFFHSSQTLPEACDILSSHTRRIQKVMVYDTAPDTVSCLTQLFEPMMPMLEEFCLDAYNALSEATCLGDSNLLPLLPALHTLRLAYAHIDWTSASAQKLRVLHLRDWTPPDENLLSLSQFLSALQEFQALEDLNMDFAFPFESYNADGVRDVSGPIVSLPNIRSLYFLCPAHEEPSSPDIYHVLAHLRVPLSAKLYVYSQVHDYITHSGDGGYLDTIPRDESCLPILHSALKANLWRQGFDCHCGEGQLGLDLESTGDDQRPWAYTPERAVRDFCTLFAKSPLQELSVQDMEYAPETWTHLFHTFPSLSVVTFQRQAGGRNDQHEHRLLAALTPTPESAGSEDGVVLPNLRALRFKAVPWNEDTLRELVHCSRTRAARGVKLRELTLRMFQRDQGDPDIEARHEALLDELDELVEEMVYTDIQPPQ